MGLPVVTVASGGLPVVEATFGTPVTEAANGRGVAVTKVIGKPGLPVVFDTAPLAVFDIPTATNITFSNGNLTVAHSSTTTSSGARVVPAKTTGKYYFEMTADVVGGTYTMGLVTAAGTYGDVVAFVNCAVVIANNGGINSNNGSSGKNIGAFVATNVLGMAVDLDARKAWLRRANGNWNGLAIGSENPATGLGGVVLAPTVGFSPVVAFAAFASPGRQVTANFGASAFSGAVPAGFTRGWPA